MACTLSACAIKSNVACVEWYVCAPHTTSTHFMQVFGTKFFHLLLGFASRTRPTCGTHAYETSPLDIFTSLWKFTLGMWLRENFPKLRGLHPLQEFHVFAAAKIPRKGKKKPCHHCDRLMSHPKIKSQTFAVNFVCQNDISSQKYCWHLYGQKRLKDFFFF